ncbi:MAG: aminoglycoside phosphotransferase family protein [Candidatus Bathyarchaeia archaeon]
MRSASSNNGRPPLGVGGVPHPRSRSRGSTHSGREQIFQVGNACYVVDSEMLEAYFSQILDRQVKLASLSKLGEGFHNAGFLITLLIEGEARSVVMRVVRGDTGWGHDYLSDRCGVLLLQHRLFKMAPPGTCPGSLDVAALMADGSLRSIGDSIEFLHFVEEVPDSEWVPYSSDLLKISERGFVTEGDRARVRVIVDYLAKLHATKKPDRNLYMRHIRDLIGHGEMLMGVIDTYPDPGRLGFTSEEELERIETESVRWRNRIKNRYDRCSRIHGDIHPFGNVRFREDGSMLALDLSREEFGEPADDLAGMSINYLFFSIWKHGGLVKPFKDLFEMFISRYLEKTEDKEILEVIAPFYAFRGVVVAHPLYYPELKDSSRRKVFNFIMNVLSEDRFDPERVEEYLENKPG